MSKKSERQEWLRQKAALLTKVNSMIGELLRTESYRFRGKEECVVIPGTRATFTLEYDMRKLLSMKKSIELSWPRQDAGVPRIVKDVTYLQTRAFMKKNSK